MLNLFLVALLSVSPSSEKFQMTDEDKVIIEQNMGQMRHTIKEGSVKVTEMETNGMTYCGRIDAERTNGTKMTGFKIYGTWFGGTAVAPISLGVTARKMCDKDGYP